MSIFLGSKQLVQAYVGDTPVNAIYQGATLIWERVQDVIVMLTSTTAGYGRTEHADRVEYTIDVPAWANWVDMVLLGAGAHGEDGVKGIVSGYRPGGKAGSWTVASSAISGGGTGTVAVARGTSQYPPPTAVTIGGRATTAASGDGVAEFTSGDTPVPKSRDEFGVTHTAGNGGAREQPGESPGGGGGGGWLSGTFGTPRPGHPGGDGYVWLRFSRVAPLVIGVQIGKAAYAPLRNWAESIGKTYETITEVAVPLVIVGPSVSSLFWECSSLTSAPQMDTSRATYMYGMFYSCSSLTTVPPMDTSQVTNMRSMFRGCSSLTTVPHMDTSQVTDMPAMFAECSALTSVPQMDTSQVTTMNSMFRRCSSLTSVPQMDTSQVTTTNSMFWECFSLTSVPEMDTSQVTNMTSMFRDCSSLTSVPQMDTSQVTVMARMFRDCTSLTSVSLSGLGNVTNISDVVKNCGALTSLRLDGLGPSLDSGQVLDIRDTAMDETGVRALVSGLGIVPSGRTATLLIPRFISGATDASHKGWTVAIRAAD